VELQLADNHGAGWGTATLQVKVDHGNNDVTYEKYAPDSEHNPLSVTYCNGAENLQISSSRKLFSEEIATAKTLTISVEGKSDGYTGALLWKAIDLQTNEVLLGNYLTNMVLQLNFKDDQPYITLSSSKNAIELTSSSDMTCQSCIKAAKFDTLSETEGLFNAVSIPKTASVYSLSSESVSTASYLLSSSKSSSSSSEKTPTAAASTRRQLLSNIYLDGKDNTWFNANGFGTTYEIVDSTGAIQFYAGQLCSNAIDACEISLPAGQYIWRVNGALDPNRDEVAWQYCGAHGGVSTELEFSIDADGHCIPEAWQSASASFSDSYLSADKRDYVLQGSFLLTRSNTGDDASFSDSAIDILKSSLAMESIGSQQALVMLDDGVSIMSYENFGSASSKVDPSASAESVANEASEKTATATEEADIAADTITTTTEVSEKDTDSEGKTESKAAEAEVVGGTTPADAKSSRKLKYKKSIRKLQDEDDTNTVQFTFHLTFTEAEFNSLRGDSDSVVEVVAALRQNLRDSMDSGNFVSELTQKASYENEMSLVYVTNAQLLKLSLISAYDMDEFIHVVDEGFSILADGVVISGCVFGVVLGIWLRQYLKKRAEQREFEVDLSRSSVSVSTSLPRSLHGPDAIHQSMRPSTVPDVEQIQ